MTTTIQAYRRTKPYAHVFPDLKLLLEFKANAAGDFVCQIDNPIAIERLLAVPTGFKVYDAGDEPPEQSVQRVLDDLRYVLQSGDETLDLRPLTDEQLHEFCKANKIAVHHAAKGNKIRDKIVEALKVKD